MKSEIVRSTEWVIDNIIYLRTIIYRVAIWTFNNIKHINHAVFYSVQYSRQLKF
jgi:hypothetical protein